jgi:branched-chain amino acid transport system permease protein
MRGAVEMLKTVLVLACCVGILALPLVFDGPYFLQTMILIVFFAYMSCSWNILGGLAGQVSLGHSAFAGIGAYTSTLAFMYLGLSPWFGMIAGGLIAGLFALGIGCACFRLKGTYFTLSTIAFGAVLRIFVLANNSICGLQTRGAQGLIVPLKGNMPSVMQFAGKTPYYYLIVVMTGMVILLTIFIRNSKVGYLLSAIKANQDAAASLGVNVVAYKQLANFTSAFLTALGGTFYAQFILYIDPNRIFGLDFALEFVLIAIIGGQSATLGPVLGAFILVPISDVVRAVLGGTYPGLHVALYGAAMMAIIMFMPQGLIKPLGHLGGLFAKQRKATSTT